MIRIAQRNDEDEPEFVKNREKRKSVEIRLICHLRPENWGDKKGSKSKNGNTLISHTNVVTRFVGSLVKGTDM